jgi:ParB family transcriptional regulator, chromosome partitioning protein
MRYEDIIIKDRYRKDMGDLEKLAESIAENGLLYPPIVDAGAVLIDGERRIRAMLLLGWDDIPVREISVPSLLVAENDANEMAKQWTVSERVAIARAIEEELAGRVGNPNFNCGNISLIAEGRSRDIAADKSGIGSGKTYEAAKRVVDTGAPEIVEAMDSGEVSINLASQFVALPEEEQQAALAEITENNEPAKEAIKDAVHNHRAQGTGENEWYTPQKYIDAAAKVMGGIDLDPASSEAANETVGAKKIFTIDDDGLTKEWAGSVWMNPPYSQPAIKHFMAKIVDEFQSGRVTEAITLTHNYTDTSWFHLAAKFASAICFTRGRIGFLSPSGEKAAPTQGQAFMYFGDDPSVFVEVFEEFGLVMVKP